MGALVNYFQGLRKGAVIDTNITASREHNKQSYIQHNDEFVHARIINYNYNFVCVPWFERRISYAEVAANQDILSFQFGGCYLARLVGQANIGYCYHIHRDLIPEYDTKNNWNRHIEYLRRFGVLNEARSALFKPNSHLVKTDNIEYWGIISDNGECFTVAVDLQRNPYRAIFHAMTKESKYFRLTIP